MTLLALVHAARARLAAAGIDANEAAMDAALLARYALGWEPARLIAHEVDPAPDGFEAEFAALVARRERREPISGITGRREFWGLEFEVTRDVLTPRPETEIVIEEAIACLTGCRAPGGPESAGKLARVPGAGAAAARPVRIADVGTGCGCLAICLAREFAAASLDATDVSAAALEVARRNARRLGVADRIAFDLAPLLDAVPRPVDLIVSNPPYCRTADIPALPPEVRDFEPIGALDGGADGLDVIRDLVESAPHVLAPGGWLIVEFGFGQEAGVRTLLDRSPLDLVRIREDLQGIPRTLVARLSCRRASGSSDHEPGITPPSRRP
jgi:release factor glutamine methyltransferase